MLRRAVGLESRLLVDHDDGELAAGDVFVLLTDGVWNALGEEAIAALLARRAGEARGRGAGGTAAGTGAGWPGAAAEGAAAGIEAGGTEARRPEAWRTGAVFDLFLFAIIKLIIWGPFSIKFQLR